MESSNRGTPMALLHGCGSKGEPENGFRFLSGFFQVSLNPNSGLSSNTSASKTPPSNQPQRGSPEPHASHDPPLPPVRLAEATRLLHGLRKEGVDLSLLGDISLAHLRFSCRQRLKVPNGGMLFLELGNPVRGYRETAKHNINHAPG